MKRSLSRAVLLVVALLASSLSLVAVSTAPAQAAVATQSHLKGYNHGVVRHGQSATFDGWVTCCGSTAHGYGFTVHLQRKVGTGPWARYMSKELTSTTTTARFAFKPSVTAYYRLYFPGVGEHSESYSPAQKLSVRRNLHDDFRRATRTYYGKVTPSYNRRWVTIQKSNCSNPTSKACRWTTYKAVKTSGTGAWSLRLPVYARRTHFRGFVKASNGYVNSWSNYYVTTYRY